MTLRRPEPRFEDLTETTGIPLSPEGADMMYTRYVVGSRLAVGRRVLELGCGAGQGLGMVGRSARFVVGGDYSLALLRSGRGHYGDRFPLIRLSAESLPFRAASFDVVLFFEASYYVPNMDNAFDEIARVLAPGGAVLFVNANPERPDFIRSPYSTHYHTADEFRRELERRGFQVTVEGAFPVKDRASGLAGRVKAAARSGARRLLEIFHLVPRTLRGRARIKRLLYKTLTTVPAEVFEGFAEERPRHPVRSPVIDNKVLYVQGNRPGRPSPTSG